MVKELKGDEMGSVYVLAGASFQATERCSCCGAQAYLETRTHTQSIDGSGLLWCAQDFNDQQMMLLARGARVVRDSRKRLSGT